MRMQALLNLACVQAKFIEEKSEKATQKRKRGTEETAQCTVASIDLIDFMQTRKLKAFNGRPVVKSLSYAPVQCKCVSSCIIRLSHLRL